MRDGLFLDPAIRDLNEDFVAVQLLGGEHTSAETIAFLRSVLTHSWLFPRHFVLRPDGGPIDHRNAKLDVSNLRGFLREARAEEQASFQKEKRLAANSIARARLLYLSGDYRGFLSVLDAQEGALPPWAELRRATAQERLGDVAGAQRTLARLALSAAPEIRALAALRGQLVAPLHANLAPALRWDFDNSHRILSAAKSICDVAIKRAGSSVAAALLRGERLRVLELLHGPYEPETKLPAGEVPAPSVQRQQHWAFRKAYGQDLAWILGRVGSQPASDAWDLVRGYAVLSNSKASLQNSRAMLTLLDRSDDPGALELAQAIRREKQSR